MSAAVGPLWLWALAALLGARGALAAQPTAWAAAGVACVGAGLGLLSWRRRHVVLASVAAAAVLFGAAGTQLARLDQGPLPRLASEGGGAPARWKVVTEPRGSAHGWWTVVRVTELAGTPGRWRASWHGEGTPPVLGSGWDGRTSARPLADDGFGRHLRSLHVTVRIDPLVAEPIGGPAWPTRLSEQVRERVRRSAVRRLPPAEAGLAVGLVTGDTRLLPTDTEGAMRAVGLTHLVAVSGSNVALVVVASSLAAALAGIGARGRRWLVLAAVLWFAFLTRWEPSVLRATTAALLVVLASWRGTAADGRHVLAATLLLLLLVDPLLAGSLGLLLSAAAAGGVLTLTPLVARRLAWLPTGVRTLVAATIAAQIAVAPLLLVHDGAVPLASVPANLVAVPAAAVASAIGIAASLLGLAWVPAGGAVFAVSGPALSIVVGAARSLEGVGPTISVVRPATVVGGALVVAWLLGSGSVRRAFPAGAVVALAAALVVVGLPGGPRPDGFTITAIDVGQGDAILLETPRTRVLIDGGPDGSAARWLRASGRRQLDLVVLSHPDADHLAGLPTVLERARVGALWATPVPGDERADRLLSVAEQRGVPVHRPVAGERAAVGDDLVLEVLHPPPDRPYAWSDREGNEMSIVLRASWRGASVLLTGDVEEHAQADLLRRPSELRADVLKVPHHGSRTSTEAFLLAPGARTAVVSAGRENRFGHPHPDVVEVLSRSGAAVRRTDREGTLTVDVVASARRTVVGAVPPGTVPRSSSRSPVQFGHGTARVALPGRRGRRPPAATQARPAPRRPPRGSPRARRRRPRRVRDRRPARPAHGVAVR